MIPPVDRKAIAQAAAVLRAGGLVGMPTETVYGLAADADNPQAVAKIFSAKHRPTNHPLIVHLADAASISAWAVLTDEARLLAERFWPGPLTMVLPKKPRTGDFVTGGQDSVALRCPSHPWAHALIAEFAGSRHGGLAAPSANSFGRISPTTAQHVIDDLGLKPSGAVDMMLDGGMCDVGVESTIINLSGSHPEMLRHGAITREMLQEVLGCPVPDAGADAPRASGRLKSHYAPRTKLEIVPECAMGERCRELAAEGVALALMGPAAEVAAARASGARVLLSFETEDDAAAYAHGLYARLHLLDSVGAGRILASEPSQAPEWAAVRDRLGRAAA